MSAAFVAPKSFEIVFDAGTPVVWAKDREAWRCGIAREAVSRAEALVRLLRRTQSGTYRNLDVADVVLLDQVERLLSSAHLISDPAPQSEGFEEHLADNILGETRCVGTLSVSGQVVPKSVEGDPDLTRPAAAPAGGAA